MCQANEIYFSYNCKKERVKIKGLDKERKRLFWVETHVLIIGANQK